ncbi:PLAC8 family-domain-containing protein [Xylariaceae sp. FL0804]|nr:PLAC8 family-domain-containing protein [Xylariaceae sp. FL0804]
MSLPADKVATNPPPPMMARGAAAPAYGGEWQSGLCECTPFSTCLLGWCLPCLLIGNTAERMRDPSMQNSSMMNSECLVYTAVACCTGCGWIYAMMKRGEIRKKYGIEGSGCGDCSAAYWCPCCSLIQQDNEVKRRTENAQPLAQGYQSQPGMAMPPAAHYAPQ